MESEEETAARAARAAAYEGVREKQMAIVSEKLRSIVPLAGEVAALHKTKPTEKPRKKVMNIHS